MKKSPSFLQKNSPIILAVIFLATLIPIIIISVYNHPLGDDLSYSMGVHNAIISGGSVFAVFQAAWGTVVNIYMSWQGTYSAVFLMSFQPGVFAEGAYAIVPLIMIGFLIFSTLRLLYTILCVCLHERRRMVVFLGLPILFLSIQYLPSLIQGFLWFNGSVYYTFFYSVMLLYFDAFIRFLRSEGKKRGMPRFILLALLAAILGGANSVTALTTLLAGFVFLLYCFLINRRRLLQSMIIQAIELTGFLISVLAPGNAFRQAKKTNIGAPLAIYYSLGQAGAYIGKWTTFITVLVFVLIIPLICSIAGRSGFSFKWPGLLLIFTLLFFASQSVPPYYAMGWCGDTRLQDIIYYSYFWMMLVNLFYFLGWFQKRCTRLQNAWRQFKKKLRLRDGSNVIRCAVSAVVFVLLVITVASPAAISRSSSGLCAQNLLSGDAQTYGRQMNERLKLYNDDSVKVVRVPELIKRPGSICLNDITDDPNATNNLDVTYYYHKDSVATVKVK